MEQDLLLLIGLTTEHSFGIISQLQIHLQIVLGQNNFYTEMEGTGLNNLNFPGQAAVTPDGKLLIADSNNNRVLVWNSFPTSSGQPANYAIDIDASGGMRGTWPWGVWSDGTKVIVSQTVGGQVLLWNCLLYTSPSPRD